MIDLTDSPFSEFVNAHRFVVVHFWAVWNGLDLEMNEVLEHQLPLELRNQIAFARLDIDRPEHWEVCRQHKVLNVPFLALYRDGKLAKTLIGLRGEGFVVDHLKCLVT